MRRFRLKCLLALVLPVMVTGCATMRPPKPPSLDLPKPPSDLRATRKGDKVTLVWTTPARTTDRQRIQGLGSTLICRTVDSKLEKCGTSAGSAPAQNRAAPAGQKAESTYTDILPAGLESETPAASLVYAVEVLNVDGRSAGLSNQVRVSSFHAFPPPNDFSANVASQGVTLRWRGAIAPGSLPTSVHLLYRVYRHQDGALGRTLTGEVAAGADESFSLSDSNIEWGRTYEYHVETVAVIAVAGQPEIQVEGDDSPDIKVFAEDIFPPAVPSGLQAVFSGPGQQAFIDLIWAPNTDVDLDGYNVYRHEEGTAAAKVNAELLKTPAYRDANVVSGKTYFYSVSAVDLRGNESAQSEEASERVP